VGPTFIGAAMDRRDPEFLDSLQAGNRKNFAERAAARAQGAKYMGMTPGESVVGARIPGTNVACRPLLRSVLPARLLCGWPPPLPVRRSAGLCVSSGLGDPNRSRSWGPGCVRSCDGTGQLHVSIYFFPSSSWLSLSWQPFRASPKRHGEWTGVAACLKRSLDRRDRADH